MADHDKKKDDDKMGRAIAAVFLSREEARGAIKVLHKNGFKHTWLGTTSVGQKSTGEAKTTVEAEGFFAGTEALVDALVKRGVDGDAARDVEKRIEPGNALLTVDPKDKDAGEASSIVTECGGRIAGGSTSSWGAWPALSHTHDDDQFVGSEYDEVVFSRR